MFITLSSQTTIPSTSDTSGLSQCRFSNGYEACIPNAWGVDGVNQEIANIIARFDSDSPPTNWSPYEGFSQG